MFRDPHLFAELPEILKTHFRDVEGPITIHDCACSSGQEALSIAIVLREKLQTEADRFHIIASDLNSSLPGRLRLNLSPVDFKILQKCEGNEIEVPAYPGWKEIDNPLQGLQIAKYCDESSDRLSPKITQLITVLPESTNMLDYLEKVDKSKPSVIMLRYVWTWLDEEQKAHLKEVLKKFPEETLLIIGDHEDSGFLTTCGFRKLRGTNTNYVLVKNSKPRLKIIG